MKKRPKRAAATRDPIALLERDHRTVEALFARFEKSKKNRERAAIVRSLALEIGLHAAIEEQVLYPLARAVLGGPRLVLRSLEEHHLVRRTLIELQGLAPDDERLEPKVWVLRENVRQHVAREERELLPLVQRRLTEGELERLGFQLENARAAYSGKGKKRRAA